MGRCNVIIMLCLCDFLFFRLYNLLEDDESVAAAEAATTTTSEEEMPAIQKASRFETKLRLMAPYENFTSPKNSDTNYIF